MKKYESQLQDIYRLRDEIISEKSKKLEDGDEKGNLIKPERENNSEIESKQSKAERILSGMEALGEAHNSPSRDQQTPTVTNVNQTCTIEKTEINEDSKPNEIQKLNQEIIQILRQEIPDLKSKFKTKKTESSKIDCLLLLINGINYNIIFNHQFIHEPISLERVTDENTCRRFHQNKKISGFVLLEDQIPEKFLQRLSLTLDDQTEEPCTSYLDLRIKENPQLPDCSLNFLPSFAKPRISNSLAKNSTSELGKIEIIHLLKQLLLLFNHDYNMPPNSILSKDHLLIMKIFELGLDFKIICIEVLNEIRSYYNSVINRSPISLGNYLRVKQENLSYLIGILKYKQKPIASEYIVPLIKVLSSQKEYWDLLKQLILKNYNSTIQNYLIQNITPFSVNILGLLMDNYQVQLLLVSLLDRELNIQTQAAKQLAIYALSLKDSPTNEIDFFIYHFNLFIQDIKSENEMIGYSLFIHYIVKHSSKQSYLCSYLTLYYEKILQQSSELQEKAILYAISGLPFDKKIVSILRKKSIHTRAYLLLYLKQLLKKDYFLNRQIYRVIFGSTFDLKVKYFIPLDEFDLNKKIVDICQEILNHGLKYHYICLDFTIKDSDLISKQEKMSVKKGNRMSPQLQSNSKVAVHTAKNSSDSAKHITCSPQLESKAAPLQTIPDEIVHNAVRTKDEKRKSSNGWKSPARQSQELQIEQDKSLFEIHLENEILKETVQTQVDKDFSNQLEEILKVDSGKSQKQKDKLQVIDTNTLGNSADLTIAPKENPLKETADEFVPNSGIEHPLSKIEIIEKLSLETLNQNLQKINLPIIKTPTTSPSRTKVELQQFDFPKGSGKITRFSSPDISHREKFSVNNEFSLPDVDLAEYQIEAKKSIDKTDTEFQTKNVNVEIIKRKEFFNDNSVNIVGDLKNEKTSSASSERDFMHAGNKGPPQSSGNLEEKGISTSSKVLYSTSDGLRTPPRSAEQIFVTPQKKSILPETIHEELSDSLDLYELEASPVKPLGLNLDAVWRKLGASSPIMDVSMNHTFADFTEEIKNISANDRILESTVRKEDIKPAAVINIPSNTDIHSVDFVQTIPETMTNNLEEEVSFRNSVNAKAIKDAIDDLLEKKSHELNPVSAASFDLDKSNTLNQKENRSVDKNGGASAQKEIVFKKPKSSNLSKSLNTLSRKAEHKSEISFRDESIYDISKSLAPGESMIIQTVAPVSIPIMKKTLIKAVELSVKHLRFGKDVELVNYYSIYCNGLHNGYLSRARITVDIPQIFVETLHPALKEAFLLDSSLFGEVLAELSLEYPPNSTKTTDILLEWIKGLITVHRQLLPLSVSFRQMEKQLKKPLSLGQGLVLIRDKISIIKLTSQSKLTENDMIRVQSTFDLNSTFGSINRVYNAAAPFDDSLKSWMKQNTKATIHVTNLNRDKVALKKMAKEFPGFERISFYSEYVFISFKSLQDATNAIDFIHTKTEMLAAYAKNLAVTHQYPPVQIPPNPTLYVALLPQFTDQEFINLIKDCRFFTNHALVCFKTTENATLALEDLNSTTNLHSNYSNKGKPNKYTGFREGNPEFINLQPKRTIYLTKFSEKPKGSLLKLFMAYSGFQKIAFYPDYSFICFDTIENAKLAIDTIHQTSQMKASFAKAEFGPFSSTITPTTGPTSCIISVSEFPPSLNYQDFCEIFNCFSGCEKVLYSPAICYAYYQNAELATQALETINSKTNLNLIFALDNYQEPETETEDPIETRAEDNFESISYPLQSSPFYSKLKEQNFFAAPAAETNLFPFYNDNIDKFPFFNESTPNSPAKLDFQKLSINSTKSETDDIAEKVKSAKGLLDTLLHKVSKPTREIAIQTEPMINEFKHSLELLKKENEDLKAEMMRRDMENDRLGMLQGILDMCE
ncbi:hypothetical protein HDV06_005925 [Boothiomyces sp. JEL0866]|nr:hypothetical protein HDV06_005925 [Boothiomyces sp. JEL0866]